MKKLLISLLICLASSLSGQTNIEEVTIVEMAKDLKTEYLYNYYVVIESDKTEEQIRELLDVITQDKDYREKYEKGINKKFNKLDISTFWTETNDMSIIEVSTPYYVLVLYKLDLKGKSYMVSPFYNLYDSDNRLLIQGLERKFFKKLKEY